MTDAFYENPNVLLLEDSELIIHLLKISASPYCKQMYTASRTKEALNILNHKTIDIIISDIHLGETDNSLPFLQELNTKAFRQRILVYSSDDYLLEKIAAIYSLSGWLFLSKNNPDWLWKAIQLIKGFKI